MEIQRKTFGGRARQETINRRLSFLEKLPISVEDGSITLTASCGLRKTYVRPKRGEVAKYVGFENLNKDKYKKLLISESSGLIEVEMISGNDFYGFYSKHPSDKE